MLGMPAWVGDHETLTSSGPVTKQRGPIASSPRTPLVSGWNNGFSVPTVGAAETARPVMHLPHQQESLVVGP